MINANEVKKDLYKSKNNAKFTHYVAGKLFYTVELADGTYQFPIATVQKVRKTYSFDEVDVEIENVLILSEDLGITNFSAEIKGSDLNRWIAKAIENEEFIKVA